MRADLPSIYDIKYFGDHVTKNHTVYMLNMPVDCACTTLGLCIVTSPKYNIILRTRLDSFVSQSHNMQAYKLQLFTTGT